MKSHRPAAAFSLTEVVLALGIVSFALVALLSLLTVSLMQGTAAREETAIAGMSGQVMATLSQQPFAKLTNSAYSYYFDADGNATTLDQAALYRCVATCSAAALGGSLPQGLPNLTAVRMSFQWPVRATNAQTRVLNATLVNLH